MSKLTEGVEKIREYFQENFGVDLRIDLNISHRNNKHINREVALYIGRQLSHEFGVDCEEGQINPDLAWVRVDRWSGPVEFSITYDGQEYMTEAERLEIERIIQEEEEEAELNV